MLEPDGSMVVVVADEVELDEVLDGPLVVVVSETVEVVGPSVVGVVEERKELAALESGAPGTLVTVAPVTARSHATKSAARPESRNRRRLIRVIRRGLGRVKCLDSTRKAV